MKSSLPPVVVIVATACAYAAAPGLGFVSDDRMQIVGSPFIASWKYLPQYFSSHVWSYVYPHLLSNYYRPLFLVWLRANESLFGGWAPGWHLTSVLAHLAVTYLVYCLAHRCLHDAWGAAAVGLIFGLDPVHVEAVAYVSAVPELLSALFLLAALLAWLRSCESGTSRKWLVGALAAYGAGLLSKEGGLMLPVFVAIYAWIYRGEEAPGARRLRGALDAAAPFLAVTIAYVPLRIWALKGFAHTVTPVAARTGILTIPSVLILYSRLLLRPVPLSYYYDLPYVSAATGRGFFLPLLGVLVAVGILVGWYMWTERTRPEEARIMAFAGLWMTVAIVPVLNFRLLPEGEIAHDRYLYLPSIGFSLLLGLAIVQGVRAQTRLRRRPAILAVVAMLASLVVGSATLRQSLYWSDDFSLNYHAHEIAPHNVSATTSLAAAVAQRGMDGAAMALYQQALAIQPGFWRANVNLAYLYYGHEDYQEAARFFSRACAADSTDGDQFLYLGMSMLRMGRFAEAEKAIRAALLVRPLGKNYHLGLGMVLEGEGRLPEARREIAAELANNPQNAQARRILADVTRQMQAHAEKPAAGTLP